MVMQTINGGKKVNSFVTNARGFVTTVIVTNANKSLMLVVTRLKKTPLGMMSQLLIVFLNIKSEGWC